MESKNKENKPDMQKFLQNVNTKWGNRPCPMCNSSGWNVSDNIFELREFHGGNVVFGNGPIIPVIPVSCNNCGNTVLVNAIISGAIEKPKSDNKNEKING